MLDASAKTYGFPDARWSAPIGLCDDFAAGCIDIDQRFGAERFSDRYLAAKDRSFVVGMLVVGADAEKDLRGGFGGR